MGGLERTGQVLEQAVETARQRVPPGDQNIVIACKPIKGKDGRSRGTQPALGPVSLHRISHLAACRHTDSRRARFCTFVGRGAHFKRQRALAAPYAALCPEEIGADADAIQQKALCGRFFRLFRQAESFLRPCARRFESTLRPPFVAIRARNPWRRLRTILLG